MQNQDRIVSLQILRFAAAVAVVVSHLPQAYWAATKVGPSGELTPLMQLGFAGVDIFFVISGFVIALTGPFARSRPSGALFFWRRWRRVAPIYFVASAPIVIYAAATSGLSADRLVASFLFWPVAGGKIVDPYLGVGWTLCYEMVFYSAMALILVGGRLRLNLAIGAAILAAALALEAATHWLALRFLTSPLFLEFGAGVLLAAIRGRLARAPLGLGALLLAAGLGAFAAQGAALAGGRDLSSHMGIRLGELQEIVAFGLPSALIVAGSLVLDRALRGGIVRRLAAGGDASYSIYLTHQYGIILVAILWAYVGGLHWFWVFSAIAAPAGVAAGLYAWRRVERPLLQALKSLRFRPALAPAVS